MNVVSTVAEGLAGMPGPDPHAPRVKAQPEADKPSPSHIHSAHARWRPPIRYLPMRGPVERAILHLHFQDSPSSGWL